MKHGYHRNEVVLRDEEHTVREIAKECPPSAFLDLRKLERILEQSRENGIDLRLKAEAEASTLALVPKRRLKNLELGLERDVEPPHLTSSAETGQKLFADLRPRAGGYLAATVCGEAFGYDLAMPVRHRYLLRMLREMIPERLNVFELLVRRELVETRRRKGRVRHVPSIADWRAGRSR
jgi:hypothetical protein